MYIINQMRDIGIPGLLDIFLMALLIYTVLVWFKRTRAAFVLTGIVIVACAYILMRQFNMVMLATVFEKFFAVILIALVVIFQEELKHFFEQVAVLSIKGKWRKTKLAIPQHNEIELLVKTLMDFGREKIGALIVLSGKDLVIRHLDGGVECDAKLSEPLFKSLFDPHSIGHDGAVIIENNRISMFSTHLPLSKNLKLLGNRGTRHASALGLSELTDAICLIVSEERGTVSIARHGSIEQISDPDKLVQLLENFFKEIHPHKENGIWKNLFIKNWREKIVATGLTIALWFVLVQGFKLTYKTYSIPVTYSGLHEKWIVDEINPMKIDVTLRGPRSAFYFMTSAEIRLFVRFNSTKEEQNINITPANLVYPNNVALENIYPEQINVRIRKSTTTKF